MTEYGSLREKISAEKKERQARYAQFEQALTEAEKLGFAAGLGATPTPMVVTEHLNPLDDRSPAKQQYYVPEGACGFAWVTIHPGNCSFAKWLVKNGHARKAYGGGVQIWISDHNQSVERKERHASAMARHLGTTLGIKCYAGSRLD